MKLLLLADPASSHTIKWANSLSQEGHSVFLFGLSDYNSALYDASVKIQTLASAGSLKQHSNGAFSKLYYLACMSRLAKIIKEFNPDLLHAHYATSYGLIGALTGFHPYIVSVWGTDILKFPGKSLLHRKIVEYNLGKADRVLATSKYLAEAASLYCTKKIDVTPFGVDTNSFIPQKTEGIFDKDDLVIGTVKTMEDVYGIGNLIHAFKTVKNQNPGVKLKLLLVGGGSQIENYKKLAASLGITGDVTFTSYVEHTRISEYHNMMDVEVYLSEYESFGVSVLEASACEKPVVVNEVGGLKEVVDNNLTGIFVKPGSIQNTADAITKLIRDKFLREEFGKNGRKKVTSGFSWSVSVQKMIEIYNETKSC